MLAYLRQYSDFTQKDWEKWLPLAEFAANNAMNESTKMSPFFANKGFHPRMSFSPPRTLPRNSSAALKRSNLQGTQFADKMSEICELLRTNLVSARTSQEIQANRNRSPAPAYKVGDMVFLDRKNIDSAKLISKLDNKYIGPMAIKKVLNSHAYQLDLPQELRSIDNSFHTSLLYPSPNTPLIGQRQSSPPPVSFDEQGQKLWQIEEITNSRQVEEQSQCKVKLRGAETAWELLENIVTAKASMAEFHAKFPRRKKPSKQQLAAALTTHEANVLDVATVELKRSNSSTFSKPQVV